MGLARLNLRFLTFTAATRTTLLCPQTLVDHLPNINKGRYEEQANQYFLEHIANIGYRGLTWVCPKPDGDVYFTTLFTRYNSGSDQK